MSKGHPQEKPHHPHWPLSCLLFAFVFAVALLSVHDPQTWLHVRGGQTIVAQGAIPRVDAFSYTVAGRAWTTDSWLADVLFWLVHAAAGPSGLAALKALAAAAGFALLLPLNPASPIVGATVLALGALSAWTGMTEIPAVFDFTLLALMIRLLRPRGRLRWSLVVAVALVELLWSNLHGTTALLGVWLAGLKAFKAALRSESGERRACAWLFAAAWLGLLCNPHGAAVIAHMFTGADASMTAWRPVSPWLSSSALFFAAGLAACWYSLQQEFFLTMAAATMLALSLLLPELRPLTVMACCPLIALAAGHFLPRRDDRPVWVARWALLAAVLLATHWSAVYRSLAPARGYGVADLEGVVGYLKSSGVRGRMFNEIEAGGPLLAAGLPVFVDGRASLYGPAFMRDAARWAYGFSTLSAIYRFDYAVVLNRRARHPARALDEDPAWRLGYADDQGLVYLRRGGASGWQAGAAAPLLRPNRLWPDALDEPLADKKRLARLLSELDRWIVQSPDAVQPLIWKAYAFDRLGLDQKADRLLEAARRRPRLAGDPELLAALGRVYERRGGAEPARALYRRAAHLARRRGERALESEILFKLAPLYREAGDSPNAQSAERRAAALAAPAFAEGL